MAIRVLTFVQLLFSDCLTDVFVPYSLFRFFVAPRGELATELIMSVSSATEGIETSETETFSV